MGTDILIVNTLVKTAAGPGKVIEPGYVSVEAGKISGIGPMAMLSGDVRANAAKIIDGDGCLVMPGLINGHNHCAMTLFRGLADDLPLIRWLQEHIFPAEAKFVDPDMVYWCTKLAAAEMIMSGTTTVADGYFYEEQAAQALKESGLRAVAAQGVIDFPAPGVPDPTRNLRPPADLIAKWAGDCLITPAIFCHSPYTCGPETLSAAKALAREHDCRLFVHLAETSWEVDEIQRLYGTTPLEHLRRLGVLDENTVCIHAVWLTEEERLMLADSGASVVTCPESNMKLASGVAPVSQLLDAGVPVGLGTDGCASNNDLDLFGEIRAVALLHKVVTQDPTILPARQVIAMATTESARALGMDTEVGLLAPGKRADMILVDLHKPGLTPRYDLDALLAYSVSGADIRSVIVDGVLVMDQRKLLTFDLEETMQQVNGLARRVIKRF